MSWRVTETRRNAGTCCIPGKKQKISYVTKCLAQRNGVVVAATDYMRNYANQIRALIPQPYLVLGTDGFGRSDTRLKLRQFFEVNRNYVVLATLKALAEEGTVPVAKVAEAIRKYGIDSEKPYPTTGIIKAYLEKDACQEKYYCLISEIFGM